MSEICEVTILMPCLNEAETLATCIEKAKQFLAQEKITGEILVADNGSSDGSQEIARKLGAKVVSVATRGYGAALRSGIQAACGRYVIMGDADDSYNFLHLLPFITKLRQGHDLVMGNRFTGGIKTGAMPFLNRYVGNPMLSFIGRVFFKSRIGDFHCGLRGFCRDVFLKLDLQGDGMEFASEMVIKATLQKLKITEVPTELYPDGRSRKPHLRPWRDGWRHLRLLLLFSPRWLFFYPGVFLMIMGLVLMGLLLAGPIVLGHVSLDIHTMLFGSLFTILGLQGICFAICAKCVLISRLKFNQQGLPYLSFFTLERGLMLGLCCILLGAVAACYAFFYWLNQAFGPLSPSQMMRILIPAVTALIVGVQLMFASFFLSLINMHYDRRY